MKNIYIILFIGSFFLQGWVTPCAANEKFSEEEKLKILNRQVALFEKGLESKPDDSKLHFNLGTKYYELGRFYEKEADALFLTSGSKKNLANARKLYRQAVDHLKASLKIQPDNPGAHFNLSLAYFVEGDGENAIAHMRKAEQLFMQVKDKRGIAKSRKALREWFDRYGYRPEDFGSPR